MRCAGRKRERLESPLSLEKNEWDRDAPAPVTYAPESTPKTLRIFSIIPSRFRLENHQTARLGRLESKFKLFKKLALAAWMQWMQIY